MRSKLAWAFVAACVGAAMLSGGCKDRGPQGQSEAPATATAPAQMSLPQAQTEAIDAAHLAKAQAVINRGVAFLLSQRNADGGWGFKPGESHPALTAMALKALLRHGDYGPDSQVATEGFECLMKFRQPDGGFYIPAEGNRNYVTSVAVMALVDAGPALRDAVADAVKFLRGIQIVSGSKTPTGETITDDHPFGGGVSYGRDGRPDLSNQAMWMEALHQAGVPGDDPAMQRALAFVKRVQARTEGTEGQAFVVRGADDGGFIYAIRKEGGKFVGESKAGSDMRGLRSYGSMTYAGFKSLLYANVGRDDRRVRAAYDWIRKHWRLDSNPNMPAARSRQGLYYYYYIFAKALRAWGQDVITDDQGVEHNWRHELIEVLAVQQLADGSWVNSESRWQEDIPTLATCYALTALTEALMK